MSGRRERGKGAVVATWLHGFLPAPLTAGPTERLRSCCGALLGLLLTGIISRLAVGDGPALPLLIAPMGASAVLLFAVPASPLAQPWSIIGGNVVSALIGVTCLRLLGDPLLAAPLAGSLAIGTMFALRCLHPPSGAVALTAVLGGPAITAAGYDFVLFPVLVNSLALTAVALAFNNATRRPYPHPQQPVRTTLRRTTDHAPTSRLGIGPADLEAVLRQYDGVLDISRDDLAKLFQRAEMHAYRRRSGEVTCADIMSRDVIAVEFGTPLQDAWSLLRRYGIRALPVLDPARRVIGLISDVDFMANPELDVYDGRWRHFRRLIRRPDTIHSDRAEVVGQIMPRGVRTVFETNHLLDLVPLMADAGVRHIAVVDASRKLSGIISQADLVAALYRNSTTAEGLSPN